MDNSVIIRSQLIEAKITGTPSVGTRYRVLEIPNLSRNNIQIYAIEAFGASQLSTTPNNNTVVADADTDQIVFTMVDDNLTERVYQIPYYTLIRANNNGFLTFIKPFTVSLTNCYIQLTDTTGIAQDEVACFNIYYYEVPPKN